MTDTTSAAPSDAEIIALADETRTGEPGRDGYILPISFARAVLAKWGTPPAVAGEPAAWLDPWTGAKVTTDYDAYGKHGIPLYTAPQPLERESAEFGRFLSDVLTAAGLVTHGKQCKALGERLADMCAKLRHHGIKGGQHGAE